MQCQENLREIGMAFTQYVQDYDDRLPAVAASGGWAISVQPYLKSWQMFQCPTDGKPLPATTDYFYNARLDKTQLKTVKSPTATILAGEGAGNQPTDYALSQLPAAWRTDDSSPAQRHIGTANYLFVDGHVKSINPTQITLDKPSANRPTFLVK